MSFQRVHQSRSQNPQTSSSTSQFAPRPFPVQEPKRTPTQEGLDNQAFQQNKFEVIGLQLKERHGTITPVEQERLGVLQAKVDDFWAQRLERASQFCYNFAYIPAHEPSEQVSAPIQPQFATRLSRASVSPLIRAKLTIGQVNNKYEQEADRISKQVLSMSPPTTPNIQQQTKDEQEEIQTKPLIEKITPIGQRQEVLEEDEPIQAKCESCKEEEQVQRSPHGVPQVQADLENWLNASKGGGSPLPNEVRSFMEPRFGINFSGVRVHTGSAAAQMNRAISAQAFTYGSDIYFGAGKSPANSDLTAHELTHIVQQTGGLQTKQNSEYITAALDSLAHQEDNQLRLQASDYKSITGTTIQRQIAGNPNDPNPCLEILQQIIELLNEIARRINDALNDPHNLFRYHRRIRDAHPDYGSWDGHRDRYYYDRNRLRQKLAEWESHDDCRGYPLTQEQREDLTEAEDFKNREFPERPAPAMREVTEEQPSPQSTFDQIIEWARRVVETGEDATQAAEEFLSAHPEIAWTVLGLGVVGILALIADDVTLAGIVDDVLIPVIAALMRVAWRFVTLPPLRLAI